MIITYFINLSPFYKRKQFISSIYQLNISIYSKEKKITQRFHENEFKTSLITGTNTNHDNQWYNTNRNNKAISFQLIKDSIHRSIHIFLPHGYPTMVSPGYGRFVSFQFISSILGTINSILAMQCLFSAIGIGSNHTSLAAALSWILKDGLGQFGGVLFASFINNRFDTDPKKWRFLSTCLLDLSYVLEISTIFYPSQFLLFASIANIWKNISFLASSASRAAIHKSFAIHENLADVTVKTGSQTTFASVIGTCIGYLIASNFGENQSSIVTIFAICSLGNILSTYISLQHVVIDILSIKRLEYLCDCYFNLIWMNIHNQSFLHEEFHLYNPNELSKKEKFLQLSLLLTNGPKLVIGHPIDKVFPYSSDFIVSYPY